VVEFLNHGRRKIAPLSATLVWGLRDHKYCHPSLPRAMQHADRAPRGTAVAAIAADFFTLRIYFSPFNKLCVKIKLKHHSLGYLEFSYF
jgi:hypothetical protein